MQEGKKGAETTTVIGSSCRSTSPSPPHPQPQSFTEQHKPLYMTLSRAFTQDRLAGVLAEERRGPYHFPPSQGCAHSSVASTPKTLQNNPYDCKRDDVELPGKHSTADAFPVRRSTGEEGDSLSQWTEISRGFAPLASLCCLLSSE